MHRYSTSKAIMSHFYIRKEKIDPSDQKYSDYSSANITDKERARGKHKSVFEDIPLLVGGGVAGQILANHLNVGPDANLLLIAIGIGVSMVLSKPAILTDISRMLGMEK